MKLATSTFTDDITVHSGDQHLTIAPGAVVNLSEPFGAGTLADALGPYVAGFVRVTRAEIAEEALVEVHPTAPAEPAPVVPEPRRRGAAKE